MTKLLLASLFASITLTASTAPSLVATASAESEPSPPAPANSCQVGVGDQVVFQVETLAKPGMPSQGNQTGFILYSNGSWRYESIANKKLAKTASGCLGVASVTAIRATLAKASWKTIHLDVVCAAVATTYTQYTVNGKVVHHAEMCGSSVLDNASGKALADVMAIVKPLIDSAK